MDVSRVDAGGKICLVLDVVVFDFCHENHLLRNKATGTLVKYNGLLDGGHSVVTLIDAVVVRQFPVPLLASGSDTKVLHHVVPAWNHFFKMVDACCGLGGVAHGALAAGIRTTVATDANARMLDLHHAHVGCDTVLGDIGDHQIVAEVWKRGEHAALMAAGFSCQPFSSLGDRQGGLDPRALTLPKVLHAAFLMQIRVLILECVVPARADPFVKRHIDAFAALMNFQIEVTNLDLASVWPCRRHRTWWIVYDRCLSPVGLCEWPTLSCLAKVQCLIPYICRWDPRDELALCLDARECLAFGVDDGTYPKHMLSAEGVAPSALHAWGSQLRACPCGCRDFGLSAQRLQEKGLFGLLVASQSEALHEQCIRHVHPSEALALNAMDCTIDFGLNVRLTLSGVGQIASPLQAIWVLSFVTARVEMLSRGVAPFEPLSQLHAFRSWLLMKCQTAWPCNDQVVQDQKLCELVGFWHDVRSLSLEQMLHVPEWPEMRDDHISVAAALDLLIRRAHAAKSNPCSVIHEPETPWFELPEHHQPCDVLLHVGASEVSFVDAQGSRGVFRFQAGATISDVLTAHAKLTGSFAVSHILDSFGQAVSIDQCMQAGHDIRVFFSVTGVESPFDFDVKVAGPKFQSVAIASDLTHEALDGDVSMDASCEPGGVKPDTVVAASGNPVQVVSTISPTAIWSGSVDVSEVNPMPEECLATTLPYHQSGGQVAALMSLTEKQFLRLAVPNLDDETKFRSLRQQFVKSADRLSLLEVQGNIWSDDEVAYHLSILTSGHDPCTGLLPDVLTIDPLLCAAWIDNRAFPIGIWACHHPEVLNKGVQVMGVSRLQSHWVPFHIVPCKEHANVHTWDAPSNDHSLLNQFLESLVLALGVFHRACDSPPTFGPHY